MWRDSKLSCNDMRRQKVSPIFMARGELAHTLMVENAFACRFSLISWVSIYPPFEQFLNSCPVRQRNLLLGLPVDLPA